MARCGCGGSRCACSVVAGPGVTITGNGSSSSPYTISAEAASGPVATGCGLTGDGTPGAPLTAAVQDWPYPCDITTEAGGVYCGPDGVLRGEPRTRVRTAGSASLIPVPATPVPSGVDVPVTTASIVLDNPDSCRPAIAWLSVYADVDFTLPPGAEACYGLDTDDMVRIRNTGTTTASAQHVQTTKPFIDVTIPPGGSVTWSIDLTMGYGSGGATYTRLQWGIRALIITD